MLFLIQKEFKQIFRNRFIPRLIFMFPIMVILVLPWVANMEIKNVKLGILDNDKTSTSMRLATKIAASSYFILTHSATSKVDSDNCIASNKCDIILEIPLGFESNLLKENNANVAIYANSINSTKGSLGSGYLSSIVSDFASESSAQSSFNNANTSEILSTYRFNPNLDYKIYMIPALMVMVLTLVCGFLPAFNIVGEKEKGNIEQINVTPISKFHFIISKLIPYWIIGLTIVSVCMTLAYLVYGLYPKGNLALLYMFICSYIFVVAGMGLIISNYSNTMQQAMFVCYFFILILILMSGLMTSIKSMPEWAQILTYFNPLRYLIESLRLIYLKGSGIESLYKNLLVLLGFASLLNIWAIVGYKKRG